MPGTAFVLGGTGQIGRAVVHRLNEAGWDVTVGSRGERTVAGAVQHVRLDRTEPGALAAALDDGFDALIDVIPLRIEDADELLEAAGRIGSVIAVSSASVYSDDEGRTLDESETPQDLPHFPVPISEGHRTVVPDRDTYSTRKAAIERVLLDGPTPTTILRPCAVYGPGGTFLREWYFVKRHIDRRSVVVLAGGGTSVFHTTATQNLAELIRLAAEQPCDRILNCGDPDPPNVLEISRAIGTAVGAGWDELLLPGYPTSWDEPGMTPWSGPRSVVLDMRRAEDELGYRPVTSYAEAVKPVCEWLLETTRSRDWREALPGSTRALATSFDYASEDALAARG